MPQANRRSTLWSSGLLALALLAGCPDPQGSFDAFKNRVPDATMPPDARSVVADISGQFLLSVLVSGTTTPIEFVSTNTFDTNSNILTMTLTPLDANNRTRISGSDVQGTAGDATGAPTNIPVTASGTFLAGKDDVKIPGAANAIIPGVPAEIKPIDLPATIQSADNFCGTVSGTIVKPAMQDLAGSTFGAIRITPGAEGAGLPAPVTDCSAAGGPDGGTGVADAGTTD